MARADEPLWLVLRADLDERGLSVRAFAKACHEASPSASRESWKRTLNRALDPDPPRPYTPSVETAELWARLLGQPADRYVRQQARVTLRSENERLREENRRLRDELGRLQASS